MCSLHTVEYIQGVPRNITVLNSLKCLLPYFVKLFDTKENNEKLFDGNKYYSKIDFRV